MQAVAYTKCLPIDDVDSFSDIELPTPVATGRDLLIKVNAIAVNPVDSKIRQRTAAAEGQAKVIGWDAVGEVVAMGNEAHGFAVGDSVFYAGELNRAGCNAQFQLIDERLVGHKPQSLSNAEAAALPLTSITAWELLFDHLHLNQQGPNDTQRSNATLLVVGAAGGVGSVLIQIAKAVTGATVIATASRPESRAWVQKLGADHVINHHEPMPAQLDALGVGPITHVASLVGTETNFETLIELMAPFGKLAMIDDLTQPLNMMLLKPKSLSFHIEFMFARSLFKAQDLHQQGRILDQIAKLVDAGHIASTLEQHFGTINAHNIKAAHKAIETHTSIGKIVLEGFAGDRGL